MRLLFYSVLIVWITGSAVCTVLNVNVWPFPSMNVFSDLPKQKAGQWVIRFTSGTETRDLDPGNVLPLEFFVARSFVGDTIKSKDEHKITALLDYIYAHARESRPGFDERWEKIKLDLPAAGQVQIILKVSLIKRTHKIETIPVAEYVMAEKFYVP